MCRNKRLCAIVAQSRDSENAQRNKFSDCAEHIQDEDPLLTLMEFTVYKNEVLLPL